MSNFTYTQVFTDRGSHKLVRSDGQETDFAGYTQFTYMDGLVGFTEYYEKEGGILSANKFAELAGVR